MKKCNSYELAYRDLIMQTLAGERRESRAGPVREIFGVQIEFNQQHTMEFPLFTGRKIFHEGVIGELTAFLKGARTAQEFRAEGCNYWDGFAAEDGYLGPIYGAQWRNWGGQGIDQLRVLVDNIKAGPTSRRLCVSAWNVGDMSDMCLPPCHHFFQANVSDVFLDLHVSMRSLDLMLGFPSDVLLYALLQRLICNETNLRPRRLIFSLGSCHIYWAHENQAFEYLSRPLIDGPRVYVEGGLDGFNHSKVVIHNYRPAPAMSLALLG